MSGPLCGQIPGPARETGAEADRALRPGRRNDEEGGFGERIKTFMNGTKRCIWWGGGDKKRFWDGVGISGFLKARDSLNLLWWGNDKNVNAVEGPLRQTASSAAVEDMADRRST